MTFKKDLDCGKCTTCCEWGLDVAIRPILLGKEIKKYRNAGGYKDTTVLAATKEGNCVYLSTTGLGCLIHNDRPTQCRLFDCRDLYTKVIETPFIKVILQGQMKAKLDL